MLVAGFGATAADAQWKHDPNDGLTCWETVFVNRQMTAVPC